MWPPFVSCRQTDRQSARKGGRARERKRERESKVYHHIKQLTQLQKKLFGGSVACLSPPFVPYPGENVVTEQAWLPLTPSNPVNPSPYTLHTLTRLTRASLPHNTSIPLRFPVFLSWLAGYSRLDQKSLYPDCSSGLVAGILSWQACLVLEHYSWLTVLITVISTAAPVRMRRDILDSCSCTCVCTMWVVTFHGFGFWGADAARVVSFLGVFFRLSSFWEHVDHLAIERRKFQSVFWMECLGSIWADCWVVRVWLS